MRPKLGVFGLLICVINVKLSEQQFLETAAVAEAAEIIGVVRIGVSLVEYIYKGKNLWYQIHHFTIIDWFEYAISYELII